MGAASVAKAERETLRIAVSDFATAMDPILADIRAIGMKRIMYDPIIGIDDEGNLDPTTGLAYKWEMSPNNKTFTVWIREGVKFHNGDELTAEDVKFSVERNIYNPKSIADWKAYLDKRVDRIEVVPPDQVVFHLKESSVIFWAYLSPLRNMEAYVVPKKYAEKVGDDAFNQNPVGSGPYRFVKQVPGSSMEFAAVENHWRVGTPKFKKLSFKRVPEEGTRWAMLQRDEVDAIPISLSRVSEVKESGFQVLGKSGATGIGVHFHRTWYENSPLGDPRVREAMNLAVNKEEILEFIFKGQGEITGNYPMGPYSGGYTYMPPIPYDPERAKQLLDEAKADYPEWEADKYRIYLHAPTVFAESSDVAQVLGEYWKAVGLTPAVFNVDFGLVIPIWGNKKEPLGLPAVHLYAYGQRWAMAMSGATGYRTDAAWREYGDADLDILYDKFSAAPNIDAWYASIKDIVKYQYDKFVTIPIAMVDANWALASGITTEWNMGTVPYDMNLEFLFSTK